MVHPRH
ncbi:hypothetical protein YPPY36_4650, partial [Yersinia pestis PY-36]